MSIYLHLEPPSPPLNVRLDSDGIGTTSIRIRWFTPTFEGVPPFSSYNFYINPPTGFDYSTPRLNELNETTRAFNVAGLLPGVTYWLTVTAVSEAFGAVAESDHSNMLEATTDFTGRNMAVKHQSHIRPGPTPQVASSTTHMSALANKERKKEKEEKKKKKRTTKK